MTNVTLEIIRLQKFNDARDEEEMSVTFGTFIGEHMFVLLDEDAAWTINTIQPCNNNTECVIKSGIETVQIKPLSLTWIVNTASDVFRINNGDYKIEFRRN